MLLRVTRWLAVTATAGMFIVLLMGATVTKTGSGEGCGASWPLCHGKFIPEFAIATAIEYSHRLVTGIEGLIIGALAVCALIGWRHHREIQVLVPVMIFVLLLQSGLGAWAVKSPQSPLVMAAHFGISLTALASVLLTAVYLYGLSGGARVRSISSPSGFRPFVFGVLGYIYIVVYLGAYIRHTNASMACVDWPLCNGQVIPGFSGPEGVVFIHRLAALAGMVLVGVLAVWAYRFRSARPDLYRGSVLAAGLILAQSLSGAFVVWTRLDFVATMSHAALAALLFACLSYLCYQVIPRSSVSDGHAQAAERQSSEALPLGTAGPVRTSVDGD